MSVKLAAWQTPDVYIPLIFDAITSALNACDVSPTEPRI